MNLSPDGQTHDRQTTQYIDNHVTAVHVRVLDRQTDRQTDRRMSEYTKINLRTLHYFCDDLPDPLLHRQLVDVAKVKDPAFEDVGIGRRIRHHR